MRIIADLDTLREWRSGLPESARIGCVPTMGALHAGHQSLLLRARKSNSHVVMSLFVNRTQFNDPEDFDAYPDTQQEDLEMAKTSGVDVVFMPEYDDLYPDKYRFRVSETDQSLKLEGRSRPGHFDGVLTVVLKLLLLIRPHEAFFGEKDYQQYELIRDMVKSLFLDIDIVSCPTIRDADGLAYSSRNLRLSPEARARASAFPSILRSADSADSACQKLEATGFEVEYVEDREGRRFGAVSLEGIRLIDNLALEPSVPVAISDKAGAKTEEVI